LTIAAKGASGGGSSIALAEKKSIFFGHIPKNEHTSKGVVNEPELLCKK
jgi:hypothetical protein